LQPDAGGLARSKLRPPFILISFTDVEDSDGSFEILL
jgi:hypothetical protein